MTKADREVIENLTMAVQDLVLALDHLAKATDVKRKKDHKK